MAKVLLVDDDLIYLSEMAESLVSFNHTATAVTSQDEALASLKSETFDIVICDTIMPGGGALSLLHEVRAIDASIPFVVITGRPEIATSPLFQKGMKEANAKIEKSATLFEIDRVIRTLVS